MIRSGCQSLGYPSCDHDDVLNQLSNSAEKLNQPGYLSVLRHSTESRGSVTRWDTRRGTALLCPVYQYWASRMIDGIKGIYYDIPQALRHLAQTDHQPMCITWLETMGDMQMEC
ncbi:hypothetical protein MGYG_01505 [Nannizzia gypsea CBS 118893]|uniref:Uncharacterized protein n=1 Tax=Arthroderma gypseum (strain ATCC MYA-4604 / CBS 118893) TaxID=535722 RepID=E5R188_ARTGP|nr:hypothetical protein MGYG_01505 [Nannizzia gypsea CBS 118893]EFQ98477.1 hypothetical protein MGYG_01505 [Nannizzia gypsea CBS 118893]